MLSNGFDKPLHLNRKPSRLFAGYLVLLHALALLALLQPLALSALAKGGLWSLLICSVGYHLRYFLQQCDVHNAYWVWQSGGAWLRDIEEHCYTVVTSRSVNTPWFVVVTLACVDQPAQRILVLRDQLDPDTFRRLRVRLKLAYDEVAASSDDEV
jgi:hypothetical protein